MHPCKRICDITGYEIVYAAAMEGKVEILVDRMGQIGQERTPYGNTVLHIAAQCGKSEFVKELLAKMDSSTATRLLLLKNSKDETALHVAAREGHSLLIRALVLHAQKLDKESDPEKDLSMVKQILTTVNKDGDTALHEALRTSLARRDMDGTEFPATKGNEGAENRFASLNRVLRGYRRQDPPSQLVDDVKMLIFPDFIYAANTYGETPLYLAAECGCYQLVRRIAVTETSSYVGPDGRTALHAAVMSDHKEMTNFLLKWKKEMASEPDCRGGWTPIHCAAGLGYAERVKQLLELNKSLGYQITGEEDGKNTAVHIAAQRGHVSVLKQLVSQCPGCWDIVNANGQNMLHVAVENEQTDVMRFFQQCGSLLRRLLYQRDKDGNTPLHISARDGHNLEFFRKFHPMLHRTSFNNENKSPHDLLASFDKGSLQNKNVLFMRNASSQVFRDVRTTNPLLQLEERGSDHVVEEEEKKKKKKTKAKASLLLVPQYTEDPREYKKDVWSSHFVVATLVATCTFAAGMSMSGGYDGKEGPHQGTVLLLRKTAFLCFLVADILAMVFSSSSMLLFLGSTLAKGRPVFAGLQFQVARFYTLGSLILMEVAFAFGLYAVLEELPSLAISVSVVVALFWAVPFGIRVSKLCVYKIM